MPERLTIRCAAEARARDEPLHGTASRVKRWLLVEQPGAWGREALLESRLDPAVGEALRDLGRRAGARVLLVRLPQRRCTDPDGARRRVYVARSGADGGWLEELDVDEAGRLLDPDLDLASALASTAPPGVGRPGPAAVHLVCTNGKHDPCCADWGRPVVRALDAAGVPDVWESSHVGGDRFAANVVSLPLGVYLGRVEPDEAPRLLRDLLDGVVDLDRYRGRSWLPPLAQSAEVFARRRLDERRLDALRLVASEARDGELAVRFEHVEHGRVDVVVARERGDALPLTCHGEPAQPWRYVLRSLDVRG